MTIASTLVCPYTESPSPREFKLLRSRMRWTQNDVSRLLGVSRPTPSNWERGSARMGVGLWELMNIKARVQEKRNLKR